MDEETFQKLVDEANAREFKNEEEAKAFFDGKLQEFSRMRLKKRKVVVDDRENNDPYYAMMKQEKQISSRYANQFDMDDQDHHAYLDNVEKSIGRYPIGFRHYENFENYKAFKEDGNIQEYHEESNYLLTQPNALCSEPTG